LPSPCYLFAKPGLLAACVAPHQYLSGRVGAERLASRQVDLDSPLRTRRATFTAPGSPEIGIPLPGLPPDSSSSQLSPSSPPTLQGAPVSRLVDCQSPGALRPVAGFPDLRLLRHLRRCPGFTARSAGLRCRTASHVQVSGLFGWVRRRFAKTTQAALCGIPNGDKVHQVTYPFLWTGSAPCPVSAVLSDTFAASHTSAHWTQRTGRWLPPSVAYSPSGCSHGARLCLSSDRILQGLARRGEIFP
jgi:hypothetical protein